VRKVTGIKLTHSTSCIKMLYLLNEDPEVIREKELHSDFLIGTLDSFIIYRLTGMIFTSLSIASTTCLINVKDNPYIYDDKLLRIFNIKLKYLPYIRPTCYQFGRIDLNTSTTGFLKKINDKE